MSECSSDPDFKLNSDYEFEACGDFDLVYSKAIELGLDWYNDDTWDDIWDTVREGYREIIAEQEYSEGDE